MLLQVIQESQGHLDADDVYRLAREIEPHISLSTVYRNLKMLKELGVISEVHLAQEHHHYELKDVTDHYHLICSSCDRVVEFDSSFVAELVDEVGGEKDFLIEQAHIDLVGLCARCRAKNR